MLVTVLGIGSRQRSTIFWMIRHRDGANGCQTFFGSIVLV